MEALYQSGDIIQDKYRIVSILGEGGTAITYEAVDLTQKSVAIKVLSLQQTKDWKLVELFEREAKVLKTLNHPRIPDYLDHFFIDTTCDRQFFLVQEMIPGKSLATLVEQGWYFQEEEVKNIAQQILEILSYLHSFQPPVIHRDIKPHNIIRTEEGEIYLVDLGAVQNVYRNTVTRGATFVGTIDYMSPEQIRGHATFASDLYSLGCTLLYLLTKRSPSELPLQRMKIDFRSSLKISEQFAEWLDIILEPALEDRFSSTDEALKQLNDNQSRYTKPPVGSLIQLVHKSNQLIINIFPTKDADNIKKGFVLIVLFILIFSLGIYSLFGWTNKLVVLSPFAPYTLVSICRLLITLEICIFAYRLGNIAFLFFGYTSIKMDRKSFLIVWNCLQVKKQYLGKTCNIQSLEIEKRGDENSNLSVDQGDEICVLYEGTEKQRFGMWLTPLERRWLLGEIEKFIIKQYPNKKQLNGLLK